MGRALFWIDRIEKLGNDREGKILRQTYIDAIKTRIIQTFKDPNAKKTLELILKKYQ